MDFKAENLIYVEEKVDNTTLDTLAAKPVKSEFDFDIYVNYPNNSFIFQEC
jgi:hypothetical protein